MQTLITYKVQRYQVIENLKVTIGAGKNCNVNPLSLDLDEAKVE